MGRTRRDHFFARGKRDDRAEPWIADAITRPPGTWHRRRCADRQEAAEFRAALYRGCRHHGISCRADVAGDDGQGWSVVYRVFRKNDGRAHVRARKTRGEPLAYDKLPEESQ